MSSNIIYQHTPYFYIIKEKSTSRLYVGAKWGNHAHPDLFFNSHHKYGYFTSSKYIKSIIQKKGISAFEIISIITDFGDLQNFINENPLFKNQPLAYVYETKYIMENNCVNDLSYINISNNFKGSATGFEHPKIKQNNRELYGTDYFIQSDEGKEANKKGCLAIYGVDNYFKSEDFKENLKTECLSLYNVEHHQSRPEIKEKISTSSKGKRKSKTHCENLSKANKGKVVAKNSTGEHLIVSKEEFETNTNLIGSTTGKVVVKDKEGKHMMVDTTDPRYISGELVHSSKGTSNKKLKNTCPAINTKTGEKLGRINTNDPRWITGEIITPTKGKPNINALNTIWVKHPSQKSKMIQSTELDQYLNNGWEIGRGNNGKMTPIIITDPFNNKFELSRKQLKQFSIDHNLTPCGLLDRLDTKNTTPTTRGKNKGWSISQ
jgi:hypothetical protein